MRELVIDCQILQTQAFHRGMGKYTTRLIKSIIKINSTEKIYQKITALLNSNLEDTSDFIKNELNIKAVNFVDLPTDISTDINGKYERAIQAVSALVEKEQKLGLDVDYLITSPFFVDFVAVFPRQTNVRKYSIVYDLIPYKIWHLQRIFPDDVYAKHFELFIQADHIFSISNAVKDDLHILIGVSKDKITSIDGGPFINEDSLKQAKSALSMKKPYILFPSAPIVHKNNERAIAGFNVFNKQSGGKYTLYVTSSFGEEEQKRLQELSPDVVFTGNISDEELVVAYLNSEAVMFASLAEGLGMPVLESVICGVPIACSDIPVLTEISQEAFYTFDPLSQKSIATALNSAAGRKDWAKKKRMYQSIKNKYSWDRSASLLLNIIGDSKKTIVNRPMLGTMELCLEESSNQNTPVGRLGEQIYAPLSGSFDISSISILKQTSIENPTAPSYVAYGDRPNQTMEPDFKLSIVTKKNILGFKKTNQLNVQLQIMGEKRKIENMPLKASPLFVDKVLKMKSWSFTDSEKNSNSRNLVEWIAGKVKENSVGEIS